MGRLPRVAEAGRVYHALNRANGRMPLFDEPNDYDAFLRVLAQALGRYPVGLLAYCVMPNHFHLLIRPEADAALSRFMGWLTLTHTQRWHAHRGTVGTGHLYQGRFKSFPIQDDGHFLVACRYIERNPLRAGLVARAEDWAWSSLGRNFTSGPGPCLIDWPIERPPHWVDRVNAALTPAEEQAFQQSLRRSQPFGSPDWQASEAERLGLQATFRPRGRPRKQNNGT